MSELMQERYGARDPRRRVLLIAATSVLAVVFLAWLAWAAVFHSTPAIDASVAAFDVVDTHEVRVRLQARLDDDAEGDCLIRATASDHTNVGERHVSADELRAQEGEWISLRTERRATTVELVRCSERD
jgi:hypothetical protein